MRLDKIMIDAGFKTRDHMDESQRAFGLKVRDRMANDVAAAVATAIGDHRDQLRAAEDAFERGCDAVDRGALAEVWLRLDAEVSGKFVRRDYVRGL